MVNVSRSLVLRALLALLTGAALVLASVTPVLAQASASASASPSPSDGQYTNGASAAADVGDVPPAFSENVTDGSEEVNETLTTSPGASPAGASIPPDGDSAPSDPASPGSAPPGSAADEITALPETGGASILSLGAGLLLVAGGLCARRMFR